MARKAFQRGDRVRLNAHGVRVCSNHYMKRGHQTDWSKRIGTVQSVNKRNASIRWDGRRTLDPQPVILIELAEESQ